MDEMFKDMCENIDSALLSGDTLYYKKNRVEFREYLERWNRVLVHHLESELQELEEAVTGDKN